MNEFKESLKVDKEHLEYREYNRKRFAREIQKPLLDKKEKEEIKDFKELLEDK